MTFPRTTHTGDSSDLLFLDVDGVLHPVGVDYSFSSRFFSHLPLLEELLREFRSVDVVISSDWRLAESIEQLQRYFSEDIRHRIIGATPLTGRSGDDDRVVFHTVDSFIATYMLRPHGARVMNCSRTPFVVLGGEPFLATYSIGSGKDGFGLDRVLLDRKPDGKIEYYQKFRGGGKKALDAETSMLVRKQAVHLGRVGGYTYGFGRAWALGLLRKEPRLAAAIARRFPRFSWMRRRTLAALRRPSWKFSRRLGALSP